MPPWYDAACKKVRAELQAHLDMKEEHLLAYKRLNVKQRRLARIRRRRYQAQRDEEFLEQLHKFPFNASGRI